MKLNKATKVENDARSASKMMIVAEIKILKARKPKSLVKDAA